MIVDPGELALATVGVSAIINGDPPKMGLGRIQEAMSIPARAAKLAKQLFDGELEYSPMPRAHDYKKLLKRFKVGLQMHEMPDLVGLFPHQASDMAGSFQLVVQSAFDHMKGIFPISTVLNFTGPVNITPDDERVWRFYSQLELLNDPLRAFSLIASAAILKSQVVAVRGIYPTLTELFDSVIYEAMGAAKAAKMSYQIPPRAEQGLATWLSRRIIQHVPPKPPEPPAAPAPPPAGKSQVASSMATRNQKAVDS